MKRFRPRKTPLERLATLRKQPHRLNLMADLRRRRYYRNGVLDASFGAAAFRLRTQVHEVVYLFRKPPKGAALEAWDEALPNDHLWRLENRRNRLEEVLAVPADEAPKKRSRF